MAVGEGLSRILAEGFGMLGLMGRTKAATRRRTPKRRRTSKGRRTLNGAVVQMSRWTCQAAWVDRILRASHYIAAF